jgi:hypothetical protein
MMDADNDCDRNSNDLLVLSYCGLRETILLIPPTHKDPSPLESSFRPQNLFSSSSLMTQISGANFGGISLQMISHAPVFSRWVEFTRCRSAIG